MLVGCWKILRRCIYTLRGQEASADYEVAFGLSRETVSFDVHVVSGVVVISRDMFTVQCLILRCIAHCDGIAF